MTPCEVVNFVSVVTCGIAECVDDNDQLALMGTIFTMLGDALVTYATYEATCCTPKETNNSTSSNRNENVEAVPPFGP